MAILLVFIAAWTVLGLSCALLFFDLGFGFERRCDPLSEGERARAGDPAGRHASRTTVPARRS